MLWQVTPVRKCQQGESSLLSGFFILLLEAHDVQGVQWINDGCSKSSKFIRTLPWLRLHCANSLKWLDDTWYMNYSSNPEGEVITLGESRLIAWFPWNALHMLLHECSLDLHNLSKHDINWTGWSINGLSFLLVTLSGSEIHLKLIKTPCIFLIWTPGMQHSSLHLVSPVFHNWVLHFSVGGFMLRFELW